MLRAGRSWSGSERNCCYLNLDGLTTADISGVSGFDLLDDARAIALTDWDQDGRLDFWVTNRTAPRVRMLRNQLPGQAATLSLRLQGNGCNADAIGARVEVVRKGDTAHKLVQTIHAGDGFHAQGTKWLHFGFASASEDLTVSIRWPHGDLQSFGGLSTGYRYLITQDQDALLVLKPPQPQKAIQPSEPAAEPEPASAAVLLASRMPLGRPEYTDFDGQPQHVAAAKNRPMLINLWASWCQPCLTELAEFARQQKRLKEAGVGIVALSVDGVGDDTPGDVQSARAALAKLKFPFAAGRATSKLIDRFEVVQRTLLDVQQPLPLPASFLLDSNSQVAAIYLGPVSVERLLADVAALEKSGDELQRRAAPFEGRWRKPPPRISPLQVVMKAFEGGYQALTDELLHECIDIGEKKLSGHELLSLADLYYFQGSLHADHGQVAQAIEAFRKTIAVDPNYRNAHKNLGRILASSEQLEAAAVHFEAALRLDGSDVETRYQYAQVLGSLGLRAKMLDQYRAILELRGDALPIANNLAWVLATTSDEKLADGAEAVRWASQVVQQSGRKNPEFLDTLAAAYARAGEFDKAIAASEEAIALFEAAGNPTAVAESRTRLVRYRAGKPFIAEHLEE
ncbi:MAG: redoxin domain-containing protein [Planctomycetales bacterium]|nr:redoxin domain-containing protein [Planctomycetales bacterium]